MHDGALPQVLFVDLAQGRGHRRRARPGHASARPSRLACGCWPRCASLEPLTCEATYAQVPGAAAAPEGALRAVRGRRLPPWTVTRPGAWFERQCGACASTDAAAACAAMHEPIERSPHLRRLRRSVVVAPLRGLLLVALGGADDDVAGGSTRC